MSFIRCLSNPEGLYVYHDVCGFISVHGPVNTRIGLRDWGTLKRIYRANRIADMDGKRLKVTHDVTVNQRGREVDRSKWSLRRRVSGPRCDLKVRIAILHRRTWHRFYLWEVTYRYLMDNAIAQDDWARDKRMVRI
jgi:hypothetical protein